MIKPAHVVHLINKAPAAEHGGFVAVAFADVLHAEHVLWYLALYLLLAANDHRNRVIALEPGVLRGLIEFARQIDAAAGQPYFGV